MRCLHCSQSRRPSAFWIFTPTSLTACMACTHLDSRCSRHTAGAQVNSLKHTHRHFSKCIAIPTSGYLDASCPPQLMCLMCWPAEVCWSAGVSVVCSAAAGVAHVARLAAHHASSKLAAAAACPRTPAPAKNTARRGLNMRAEKLPVGMSAGFNSAIVTFKGP